MDHPRAGGIAAGMAREEPNVAGVMRHDNFPWAARASAARRLPAMPA